MSSSSPDFVPDGVLPVRKPSGMTSHDVVAIVRRKLGVRRIGHTGTLDPLAEGLLLLLIGRATSQQQAFQGHDKAYEVDIALGAQTDTGDADGTVIATAPVPPLDASRVQQILADLEGPQTQTPPAYSAVKVQGRPSYWWARHGTAVALPSRAIRIDRAELLACGGQTLSLRISCSAGTYVRVLAETIAQRLGTVGHVSRLVRTRIDAYRLDDAMPLAWIQQAGLPELQRAVQPLQVSRLP